MSIEGVNTNGGPCGGESIPKLNTNRVRNRSKGERWLMNYRNQEDTYPYTAPHLVIRNNT